MKGNLKSTLTRTGRKKIMENIDSNVLKPKTISELLENKFFIRHYQRGYRWTSQQVLQLLDDIDSFIPREVPGKPDKKTFYCLQPIVLKKLKTNSIPDRMMEGEWYEVIDGQQRLTTIYLILQYINEFWTGRQKKNLFEIDYQTRENCVEFLQKIKVNSDDITVDINKENIDFYHISKAYQTIRNWEHNYQDLHSGKLLDSAEFQSKFLTYSKIIWYEVKNNEDSEALFERLNIGKIPLTNAELTKALFLSEDSFKELGHEEKQLRHFEIALLWDEMEHKLNEQDMKFWSFITNKKRKDYDTKIELILDLIAGKKDGEKDPLFTFLHFNKQQSLAKIWSDIELFYHTLLEWNSNRDLYHKIGYLIACNNVGKWKKPHLNKLINYSMTHSKDKFNEKVTKEIKKSIACNITELRYPEHNDRIFNLLLLFNVETYRFSKSIDEFYPFKQHKDNCWSLEHIHARNSEGLDKTKQIQWKQWLELHLPVLRELGENGEMGEQSEVNAVISEIEKYNNDQLTWNRFSDIFDKVNDFLTCNAEQMDIESDGISNLALLSQPDNAALNNSVFEVKRREVIRLDKEGSFIPVCTRRIFLKYYQNSDSTTQNFFWAPEDRQAYLKELTETLENYMDLNATEEDNDN